MGKTRIEWADETWNPVWGCKNDCAYCYARDLAWYSGKNPDESNFVPHWRQKGFDHQFNKSTRRVFVNSMSDIMYWEEDWMDKVLEKIRQYPHIQFIFLTKGGFDAYAGRSFPDNVVCGITVDKVSKFPRKTPGRRFPAKNWLLNIEPMLESFFGAYVIDQIAGEFDWIILGALTRKGEVVQSTMPELDWYSGIIELAQRESIPVFVKPSLESITPKGLYLQQFIAVQDEADWLFV